jgi:4-hydroxy-2-oxoglutarate aldolase
MNKKLSGVFIPIVTPFKDQKVNLEMLESNILKSNSTSVAGYMPLGSNGEFIHMDDEEQLAVFRVVKENSDKNKTIMAGIARQSAYCTIEFGKRIQDEGVDFFSVLCPSYFASSMTDAALIRYYLAVAESLSVPVLLYNCPKFAAGVTLSPQVVKELSKHPNIAGMKDTSSGNIEKYLDAKEEGFEVVAGSIENFLTGLISGASGGVLSMANYLPEPCCRIQDLYLAGRVEEAKELSNKLIDLNKGAAGKYGVAGVKAACEMFGYKGGEVRNPLTDCTETQKESIRHAFSVNGYL